jgi:endogenous inhibitor of DNA gyrase (YacG/DUF329 family)
MEAEARDALPFFPFCSARCRQIDLGRWLGEQYGIPVSHSRVDPDAVPEDDDPAFPS